MAIKKKLFAISQGTLGTVAIFSNRKKLWEGLQKELGDDIYYDYHAGKPATYLTLSARLRRSNKLQVANPFGEITEIKELEMNKI